MGYNGPNRKLLQLCSHPVIVWPDAPSGVFGLRFIQMARQFEPEIILMAVGWYLRFSLSYGDIEELLAERGLSVDHVKSGRSLETN
jgi:hypothetical protein